VRLTRLLRVCTHVYTSLVTSTCVCPVPISARSDQLLTYVLSARTLDSNVVVVATVGFPLVSADRKFFAFGTYETETFGIIGQKHQGHVMSRRTFNRATPVAAAHTIMYSVHKACFATRLKSSSAHCPHHHKSVGDFRTPGRLRPKSALSTVSPLLYPMLVATKVFTSSTAVLSDRSRRGSPGFL